MMESVSNPLVRKSLEKKVKMLYLQLLCEGREVYLSTAGSSMYPFIKGGDIIKVAPVKEEDLRIGDILTVDIEGKGEAWFCVHRLVKIIKRDGAVLYMTKGDGNTKALDRPVGFSRIKGKVIETERNGLGIHVGCGIMARLNPQIAKFSLKHPVILRRLAPYISLLVEWRWFFKKLICRFRGFDEPLRNAELLLFATARTSLSQRQKDYAKKLIQNGISWSFFLEQGRKSGLSYLLYNSLKELDHTSLIPGNVIHSFKETYIMAVPAMTTQLRETAEIAKRLESRSVATIHLKGAFLAESLYRDPAARGMSVDIDILVREGDKKKACETLQDAGYKQWHGSGKGDIFRQYIFRKKDNFPLDLHWDVGPVVPSADRMPGLWEQSKKEAGRDYRVLKPEALLIQLAIHLVDSAFLMQLRYVTDINELLTKHKDVIDWALVIENSKRWNAACSVYTSLIVTIKTCNAYVPGEVLKALRPSMIKRAFIDIFTGRAMLLQKNSLRRSLMSRFFKYILFQLLEARSIKDYAGILFPPGYRMGGKSYAGRLSGGLRKLLWPGGRMRRRKDGCKTV